MEQNWYFIKATPLNYTCNFLKINLFPGIADEGRIVLTEWDKYLKLTVSEGQG